jgi:hypothetical protein
MSLSYFPMKVGDTGPDFEAILKGSGLPLDLTGAEDLRISWRRVPGQEPVKEFEAEIVNPSGQSDGHADRGRIRHGWAEGDTELLFGEPEDPTQRTVVLYGECEMMRDGQRITVPTEGYMELRLDRDIVEDFS